MQETIVDKTEELKSLQGKKEKMEKELLKLTSNKKTVEKNISMISVNYLSSFLPYHILFSHLL